MSVDLYSFTGIHSFILFLAHSKTHYYHSHSLQCSKLDALFLQKYESLMFFFLKFSRGKSLKVKRTRIANISKWCFWWSNLDLYELYWLMFRNPSAKIVFFCLPCILFEVDNSQNHEILNVFFSAKAFFFGIFFFSEIPVNFQTLYRNVSWFFVIAIHWPIHYGFYSWCEFLFTKVEFMEILSPDKNIVTIFQNCCCLFAVCSWYSIIMICRYISWCFCLYIIFFPRPNEVIYH